MYPVPVISKTSKDPSIIWTSSSFQSCCTQRGSDGGLVARTCMTRRWLLPRLKSSWRSLLESCNTLFCLWIKHHIKKPLDYQDSCLRDSTCPTQLKKFHYKQFTVSRFLPQRVDLPPAQEMILLQKNLCQDSCLGESTGPQLKKLKKNNLVWISEPH